MPLDYPFYAELRRRGHPAGKWRLRGDILYYLGLLPAFILVIPFLWSLFKIPFSRMARWQAWALFLFAFFAVIFLLGTRLKLKAWKMAAKDGIKVKDYETFEAAPAQGAA